MRNKQVNLVGERISQFPEQEEEYLDPVGKKKIFKAKRKIPHFKNFLSYRQQHTLSHCHCTASTQHVVLIKRTKSDNRLWMKLFNL